MEAQIRLTYTKWETRQQEGKENQKKKKKVEAVKIENFPKLMPVSQYMIPAL